jgi:alpha-tubulin suppressor-like RCC1 family protein
MDFMGAVRGAGSNRRWSATILVAIVAAMAMVIAASAQAHAPAVAKAWGRNDSGQLGSGTTEGPEKCGPEQAACSASPVAVAALSGVTAVASGWDHGLAVEGGKVMAWGNGSQGQLGDGTTTSSDLPVEVTGLTGVVAVAAGTEFSLALLSDGKVMAWGLNSQGQLGDGTTASSDVPVEVTGLTEKVTAIAAGYQHGLAVLEGGKVVAWGKNLSGQLGNGTETSSDVPVEVTGLTEKATAVAGGEEHSLALLEGGKVVAWGHNDSGQLGDGGEASSDVPVQAKLTEGAVAIAAGGGTSLAVLKASGKVVAWGSNASGELGDNSHTGPESCGLLMLPCSKNPVAVCTEQSKSAPPPACGNTLSGAIAIAVGREHSLALLSDGAVMAWGENSWGQLGDGASTGPEPCEVTPCSTIAIGVSKVTGAAGIAAGKQFSLGFGPPPTVTLLKPTKGSVNGGTKVLITGEDFTGATEVKFGSTPATSFTIISPTEIGAVAPAESAGTVDVTVGNTWGTSATSSADQYTYAVGVQELPELGRCRVEPNKKGAYGGTTNHCVTLSKKHNGSFEWMPGPGSSRTFREELTSPKLETASKKQIICTALVLTGEYTGAKTETVSHIEGVSCEEVFHHETCSTSPSRVGFLESAPGAELEGELGFIVGGEKPQVGWDLKPKSPASAFFTFTCGPTSTSTEVLSLEGSVIGRVLPINKMVSGFGLHYKQLEGKQVPERFEGGVKDTLLLKTAKSGPPPSESFEQLGLKTEGSIQGKEELEIKAKV